MQEFEPGERVAFDGRWIGGSVRYATESGFGDESTSAVFFNGRRGTVIATKTPVDLTGLAPAFEPRVDVQLDLPSPLGLGSRHVVVSPISLRRLDAIELLAELA